MKYILPFEKNASFRTYTFWAHYLGIMQGQFGNIDAFLFNNFIILPYFMFANRMGYTAGYRLQKNFQQKEIKYMCDNFIEQLKQNLLKGRYAVLDLNSNKILGYNKNHEAFRDWVIYGFNDEDENFYAIGYIWDDKYDVPSYDFVKVSYDVLLEALPQVEDRHRVHKNVWLDSEFTLEVPNLNKIKCDVFCWGYHILLPWANQGAYRVFYKYNNICKKNQKNAFDIKPLSSIVEHKRFLFQLIDFYFPASSLSLEYKKIYNMANSMLMIARKYNFKADFNKFDKINFNNRINKLFIEICKHEPKIIRKLFRKLNML